MPKPDQLYHFLLADGAVRGALVSGTKLVQDLRRTHDLGILETLVLGHAGLGVALLVATLKGNDGLSLQIDCSGPIKGLTAEAEANGSVRGFLKQVPIPLKKSLKDFNLSPFFGAGFLTITRYLEDAKQPFAGKVALKHGNIGQDLAHYFLTSEQNPTSFTLSVQFDNDGEVTGAGGLFLQAMPDADDQLTADLHEKVLELPSLGSYLSEVDAPGQLMDEYFFEFSPAIIATKPIKFQCLCSREKLRGIIMGLPITELDDIINNGPFPVEGRCHYCSTKYSFKKEEIEKTRKDHLATH